MLGVALMFLTEGMDFQQRRRYMAHLDGVDLDAADDKAQRRDFARRFGG